MIQEGEVATTGGFCTIAGWSWVSHLNSLILHFLLAKYGHFCHIGSLVAGFFKIFFKYLVWINFLLFLACFRYWVNACTKPRCERTSKWILSFHSHPWSALSEWGLTHSSLCWTYGFTQDIRNLRIPQRNISLCLLGPEDSSQNTGTSSLPAETSVWVPMW